MTAFTSIEKHRNLYPKWKKCVPCTLRAFSFIYYPHCCVNQLSAYSQNLDIFLIPVQHKVSISFTLPLQHVKLCVALDELSNASWVYTLLYLFLGLAIFKT